MKKQATLTQLESARQGIVTDKMLQVATTENIDPEILRRRMEQGGLDPSAYDWYLDLRRHGSVPLLRVC